ncbi:GGDEF domain-containing protein [Sulfuriferula thiophila]|uniref:GGDEF domain-containing protein n=1 Tax=Sulfuriferula thiophila TaxID=1781211 RepID=UPI000F60FC56|nr:GGDEF domain-containing protein [Sulfuriferula thiophila]
MSKGLSRYKNVDSGFFLKSVLAAFITLIVLVLGQITYGINQLDILQKKIEESTSLQFEKLRLLSNAETVGVRRNASLIKMTLSKDEAERRHQYQEYVQYNNYAMNAIKQLLLLETNPKNKELLEKQAGKLQQVKRVQLEVISILQAGDIEAAKMLLLNSAIQQQNQVRDGFVNLRENQQNQVQIVLKKVQAEYESTRTAILWTGLVVTIAVVLISLAVLFRLKNHVSNIETELSDLKANQSKLHKRATRDALTGLANKSQLNRFIQQRIKKSNKAAFAVMYLDLDGFKKVNDEFGHAVGDRLLSLAAQRMQGMLRESDFIARVGGDEFIIILQSGDELELVGIIASQLIAFLGEPFSIGSIACKVGVSVGVAYYPMDGKDAGQLIHNADQAMYVAKRNGKNQYAEFDGSALEK